MTEREKFELWAESQGWSTLRYSDDHTLARVRGKYKSPHLQAAYEAWLAAKQQAHCEALADLHKLERDLTNDNDTPASV